MSWHDYEYWAEAGVRLASALALTVHTTVATVVWQHTHSWPLTLASTPALLVTVPFFSQCVALLRRRPQWTAFPVLGVGYWNTTGLRYVPQKQLPDWVPGLEAQCPAILAELDAYSGRHDWEMEHGKDSAIGKMGPAWSQIWLDDPKAMPINELPVLKAALAKVSGIYQGQTIKKLSPGSIPPHRGSSDAYFRCHMPLRVPDGGTEETLAFVVGGEKRVWRAGQFFAFNDANYHYGYNRCTKERIIILFDAPNPRYSHVSVSSIEHGRHAVAATNRYFFDSSFLWWPLGVIVYAWRAVLLNIFSL